MSEGMRADHRVGVSWHVVPQTCMSGLLSSNRHTPPLPPTHPRTQDKVDTAMHWQPNVERRSQTKLFCATFSSFTLTPMQEPWNWFSCVVVTPRTETTVNLWHNWVWTVSSGHERVAWGLDGERHTRGGQWWIVDRGLPSGAMLAALRRLGLPTPLPGPTSPLPTACPERERERA